MQYFKDPSNNTPYAIDDYVVVIVNTDGTRTFEVQETVHVPDVYVHHDAVIVHHAQVLGLDEKGQPIIVTPAYDETITAAYDEVTVPAHDEQRTLLTLQVPNTLLPITQDEFQSLEAANLAAQQTQAAALPNPQSFITDVKTGVGGIVAANVLAQAYPLFFPAVQEQNWQDLQALIIDAHTNAKLNDTQYNAIKTAATNNKIPLTLP